MTDRRRYSTRTTHSVIPSASHGIPDNRIHHRQNYVTKIEDEREEEGEENEEHYNNKEEEEEEEEEHIQQMLWLQRQQQQQQQRQQRRRPQQQQNDEQEEENEETDNISEELVAIEREISLLEGKHQDLTAILKKQNMDITEADKDHSTIHKELQEKYRKIETLKKQQLAAEKERKKKDEIGDKIRNLCNIVGWQKKEIEYSRTEWSRLMVGRLDGQTKALVMQNQEIVSEVAERDFFEKARSELFNEIKSIQHDLRLCEEQVNELSPAIARLEEIERVREIEIEYFESWRAQRETEIQLGKMELDEYYNEVINDLEKWADDESHLKEDRKMSEEVYNARLKRLKDRGLNAWA